MRTVLVALSLFSLAIVTGCVGRTTRIDPARRGIRIGEVDAHATFTKLLKSHVRDGHVDYPSLCGDVWFDRYLGALAATDPDAVGEKNDRLAFWINTYNAFTVKVICDNYPLDSINDLHFGGLIVGSLTHKTIWDKRFVLINGETLSLNDIEHKIIRGRFEDPRVHFALVCASKSCPQLRATAYEGSKLDDQLDDQGRLFFAQREKNHFDADRRVVHLSRILDWYADDFGKDDEAILRFVAKFLPDSLAGAILANPEAWKIKHTKYDWSLNE